MQSQENSVSSTPHFYRQPLPSTCVDFTSDEGKQLFIGAMSEGHTNIYFKLAAQYLTQEQPNFCGVSTLVMVLHALEVDPARVWKGPWRWYHESMLNCCIPLEMVAKVGITADQFECIGRRNRLRVQRYNPPPIDKTDLSPSQTDQEIQAFRATIRDSVRSTDRILVVSYCRRTFRQHGLGHFSPLAAYNEKSDKVLLMDVARYKYPPHWVDVLLLWSSMRELDPNTTRPRAYFVLALNDQQKSMLFTRMITPEQMTKLICEMEHWFVHDCRKMWVDQSNSNVGDLVGIIVQRLANELAKCNVLDEDKNVLTEPKLDIVADGCCKQNCDEVFELYTSILTEEIIAAIRMTPVFEQLKSEFRGVPFVDDKRIESNERRDLLAVGLFLSWPFETAIRCPMNGQLSEYCRRIVEIFPVSAQNEVVKLKVHTLAVLGRKTASLVEKN